MGVLDDAIREHLELKRQHGARDSEIKELEDQAFGPPSRPGEPDFPESPEDAGDSNGEPAVPAAGTAVAEPPEAPPETVRQDTQPFDAAAAAGAPPGDAEAPVEPELEEEPGGGFFDRGQEVQEGLEAKEADPAVVEEDAGAMEEDLGVEDLDLGLEEDSGELPGQPEPKPEPPAVEDAAPAEAEQAPLPQTEEQLLPPQDPLEEEEELELSLEPEEGDDEAGAESGEDVLEETPEFLRESPDDEELWFEQGAPKDFDFEDEEE